MKHALRSLAKSPGFTATALATLAICLGANLTIFAVVDAVLIKPLPYPDSGRLVTLYYTYPNLQGGNDGASLTTYYERRGQIPALSSIAAIDEATSIVGETGTTSIEKLGRVTPEFFDTLGIKPLLGRAFTEAEMTYQTDHVAVLSFEYWHTHFNADPAVLGKSIRMDGMDHTIVGVLPPDFRFLSFRAPLYMPFSSDEGQRSVAVRYSINSIQIGRIAVGATLGNVRAQIAAHDAAHAAEFPLAKIVADTGCYTVVAPLHADHVKSARSLLLPLQGGALCLFLIGGVNLANLLLIRASGRSKELAIRQALGANRGRVVRDTLVETIGLTVAGGLPGLLVGAFGIDLLSALGADQLPLGAGIVFDFRIAVIGLIAALVSGFLLGLPIVWFNLRSRLAVALQSESRGSTVSRTTQRLRHGFIVAQISLAFVLIAGAGLLGLSLKRAMAVSPGFRADHVITGQFTLTRKGYHTDESFSAFFNRLSEKAGAIPGVSSVGVVSTAPIVGNTGNNGSIAVPGHKSKPGEDIINYNQFGVAGDYFSAMGIPLREGRYLAEADSNRKILVCVVDENFAHFYWPEGGALGKTVYRSNEVSTDADNPPYTIVGVVGAVKQASLTEATLPGTLYFPHSQVFMRNFYLAARTTLPPEMLGLTLKKIIREIDPDVPLTDLRTMEARIDRSLIARRSPAILAGIFAATALLLACIGLYGVMAYAVAQRTREFGIRLALGARPSAVLSMVFNQGVRLAAIGLTAGAIGALLLANTLSSLLYSVKGNDPFALAGVALVIGGVAALACWFPARRATKVDPMVALRSD